MSKGTIVSEAGSGEYVVKPAYDLDRAQQKIASLEAEIDELTPKVAELQAVYDEAVDDLRIAANLLTNALNNGDPEQIKQAETVWIEKLEASQLALAPLQVTKVKLLSKQKKLSFINENLPDDSVTVTAWCADFTEGLTGEVGLIDFDGAAPVIQPGWNPSPTPESFYDPARDGVMTPPESFFSGSGLYRALALYDGWQLFKPTYRTGVITSISGDTCSVNLDNLQTRYIGADANREMDGLANVEIVYMECNGAVFGEGDHVVVAFVNQNPDVARVVGFVSNPIPCVTHGVLAFYGIPSVDQASYLYMHSNERGWMGRQFNAELEYGAMEWLGPKNAGNGYDKYLVMQGQRDKPTSFGEKLMQDGKVVATAPRPVMGGGIATVSGTDYFVIAILDDDNMWQAAADVFMKRPVDDDAAPWEEIGQVPHSAYGLDATYHHLFPNPQSTAYLFSESATKAIKLQRAAKVPDPTHSFVDNPDWETEVPITSSPSSSGSRAQHVLEAWLARNQYEDSPIVREAYVVEVTLAGDLSSLTYDIEQDVPTITETGTRPEDWEDGSHLADPTYQEHAVTSQSLHLVDYVGETKTELTMEHTATRSLTLALQESEFSGEPFADVVESTRTRGGETIFRQDGAEILRCTQDVVLYKGSPYDGADFWGEDWSMVHTISDLLAIDLRFGLIVAREIDIDLSEVYTVVGEPNNQDGEEGTQTLSYTESIVLKSTTAADTVIASETVNETVVTPLDTEASWSDAQPPFDRMIGYQDLQTGLGEVVVSPGSGSWPEFAGKPLIGPAFFGALGADTVPGTGEIYTTKSGARFAGGRAQSRSISDDTDGIEWGEKPYPEVSIFSGSDGDIDDAVIVARGKLIGGGWVLDPGADSADYADIPDGWLYRGAVMV